MKKTVKTTEITFEKSVTVTVNRRSITSVSPAEEKIVPAADNESITNSRQDTEKTQFEGEHYEI